MDDLQEAEALEAALDALGESPTTAQILDVLKGGYRDAGVAAALKRTAGGGGGSQTVKRVRVPIAFDTPGLDAEDGSSTGIVVYIPAAGDALLWAQSYLSLTTGFNYTAPATQSQLFFTFDDVDNYWANLPLQSFDVPITDQPDSGNVPHFAMPAFSVYTGNGWPSDFSSSPFIFPDATPLRVVVAEESGGPAAPTQGDGEIVLLIVTA